MRANEYDCLGNLVGIDCHGQYCIRDIHKGDRYTWYNTVTHEWGIVEKDTFHSRHTIQEWHGWYNGIFYGTD
jgi:hypothetical protein